jgi:hypothetical protein
MEAWKTRWIDGQRRCDKLMIPLVVGTSIGELNGLVIELGVAFGSSKGFTHGRGDTATEQHKG